MGKQRIKTFKKDFDRGVKAAKAGVNKNIIPWHVVCEDGTVSDNYNDVMNN